MLDKNSNSLGFVDAKKEEKIAEDGIKNFKIKTPSAKKKIVELSGGNQQKCIVARWISTNPKVLILDEPTSMLDVSVQAQVMTLLKELQEKLGLSYLFISHDLDVVRWFCDEIAVMEEGKFVETGRTEDVIGHPKMEFTKKLVENFILE